VNTHGALELRCHSSLNGDELARRLSTTARSSSDDAWLLVVAGGIEVSHASLDRLRAGVGGPLVASSSPVPVDYGGHGLVPIRGHHAAPPPAAIPLPCLDVCLLSTQALLSDPGGPLPSGCDWRQALAIIMQRLSDLGWRHVVSPGVAFRWTGTTAPFAARAGWSTAGTCSIVETQPALEAHRSWAATQLRPCRVVVDGACVTEDEHNGTQVVVTNTARALAAARPDSHVALAVEPRHMAAAERLLRGSGVTLTVRRSHGDRTPYDVAYRPYQAIDPSELDWLTSVAPRLIVGQLDTIAFSNPSYHPNVELFHFVRNLQRHMLRIADGVTFISEFGRMTTQSECPEVPVNRLHVVGCGVDVSSNGTRTAPEGLAEPFIACLSATFHHKNRPHAIRTFAALCDNYGYGGRLVIAGPEPYYGSSDEQFALAGLRPQTATRVLHLGRVATETKWWLLETADLVLYPSVVEGFGLIPFEAAAVGTASLSFRGSGLAEILGENDALLTTWDADRWAERAAALLHDSRRREALVASVQAIGNKHRWADVAERTWAAIDATIAQPKANPAEEGGRWASVARNGRTMRVTATGRHRAARARAAAQRLRSTTHRST
jgi:glycosyltransferase involved in cell wall biosynthesis